MQGVHFGRADVVCSALHSSHHTGAHGLGARLAAVSEGGQLGACASGCGVPSVWEGRSHPHYYNGIHGEGRLMPNVTEDDPQGGRQCYLGVGRMISQLAYPLAENLPAYYSSRESRQSPPFEELQSCRA